MIIPNNQYAVIQVSKADYEKHLKTKDSISQKERLFSFDVVFEGRVYAIGENGYSQNPVAATKDNHYVFARIPDDMGMKKGDRVIVSGSTIHEMIHEDNYLLFVFKESIICVVRDSQEEINLFNQDMEPVKTSTVVS